MAKPGVLRVEPLGDRVLVKRSSDLSGYTLITEGTSEGNYMTPDGIVVPASSIEVRPEVEVIAMGSECPEWLTDRVKVGDSCLIGQHAGEEYETELLLFADELLAVLHDPNAEEKEVE